jgi:DNA-binding IclR family transcriptional regulator
VLSERPAPRSVRPESGLSSLDRALVVLEACALSNSPLNLTELVRRTELPKTTVHRLCSKLVELGMLDRTPKGFRIGIKVYTLGNTSHALRRLRTKAMPHLHDLVNRTGWATNLVILAGARAFVVEEVFGKNQAQPMRRMAGARLPLHATAVGKALLAGCHDQTLEAVIAEGLTPYTNRTIVRGHILREQIQVVRESRIAYSDEEWTMGSSGVASLVVANGAVVAAVGVVGDPGEAGLRQRATAVKVAAAAISSGLSGTPFVAIGEELGTN